jgi:hypothetical protein
MKKIFVVFAILCLAAPVMAADWNFYGSARMATFYVDVDPDVEGVDSDSDLQWAQQGNSRIGATVEFNDEIGGGFEMSDSFGKRKLYGTYNFGGGELLLGQTYTPTTYFYSNSVYDGDGDLLGVGQFYEGRLPMIQLKFGGFKVALITPSTATASAPVDIDTTIPKIEASYGFKSDFFFVDVFAGYNSFTDERGAAGDLDYDSYVLGVGGGITFGPAYVSLGAHMGQNLGNYGAYNPSGIDDEAAVDATGELRDNNGVGFLVVGGFNLSESLNFEGGFGIESSELDIDGAQGETVWQAYVNTTITIAPGFFIVPEIGYIKADYEAQANGTDPNPTTTYFGAKWQINF